MAPINAADHTDSPDESVERSSDVDSPYTNEELAGLVKVRMFTILYLYLLTVYSTDTTTRKCRVSGPVPQVDVWCECEHEFWFSLSLPLCLLESP